VDRDLEVPLAVREHYAKVYGVSSSPSPTTWSIAEIAAAAGISCDGGTAIEGPVGTAV
jgi:hypothetical protein